MAKLEFVDGEPPIIRVSGDLGPGDELQGNEYKPFESALTGFADLSNTLTLGG